MKARITEAPVKTAEELARYSKAYHELLKVIPANSQNEYEVIEGPEHLHLALPESVWFEPLTEDAVRTRFTFQVPVHIDSIKVLLGHVPKGKQYWIGLPKR